MRIGPRPLTASTRRAYALNASLVARAAQGDQSAWNDLVTEHTRLLWAVARSRLDASDAEEVVQTTWIRLAMDLDRIDDPSDLVTWLAGITHRETTRTLRRRRPTPDVGGISSVIVEPTSRTDWRTEAWRGQALLLAALYFTLTAAAEFEFRSDLLTKLEAHLVFALAIWGYYAERNRRKDR